MCTTNNECQLFVRGLALMSRINWCGMKKFGWQNLTTKTFFDLKYWENTLQWNFTLLFGVIFQWSESSKKNFAKYINDKYLIMDTEKKLKSNFLLEI